MSGCKRYNPCTDVPPVCTHPCAAQPPSCLSNSLSVHVFAPQCQVLSDPVTRRGQRWSGLLLIRHCLCHNLCWWPPSSSLIMPYYALSCSVPSPIPSYPSPWYSLSCRHSVKLSNQPPPPSCLIVPSLSCPDHPRGLPCSLPPLSGHTLFIIVIFIISIIVAVVGKNLISQLFCSLF